MKQLGILMPILLLLGVGIASGLAAAELSVYQQPAYASTVGVPVAVMVDLANTGESALQATVMPSLQPGVMTNIPDPQGVELGPGMASAVSYPVWAEETGQYVITSLISYSEEGTWRQLSMSSDFTVT